MILEVRNVNEVNQVRCSDYNNNQYMNIIDIRIHMATIMKIYKTNTNETTKEELVKNFTILEKMTKYL